MLPCAQLFLVQPELVEVAAAPEYEEQPERAGEVPANEGCIDDDDSEEGAPEHQKRSIAQLVRQHPQHLQHEACEDQRPPQGPEQLGIVGEDERQDADVVPDAPLV